MKIPDHIQIIGHNVNIFHKDVIDLDGKDECGIASFGDGIIILAEKCHGVNLSEDVKLETFLHEVLHFLDEAMVAKLTEKQTQKIARGLYCFIKDNKFNFLDNQEK